MSLAGCGCDRPGYFALQAVAGAVWWILVFASVDVRRWTLGNWNHKLLAMPDLLFFVGASAFTAWRKPRWALGVVGIWTAAMTSALVIYALVTRHAGWGAVIMVVALVGTVTAALTLWHGTLPVDWFFVGPFTFRPAQDHEPGRHLATSLAQLVVFWTFFLLILPSVLAWIEHRIRMDWSALDHRAAAPVGLALFLAASCLGLWSCLTMALRGEGTPLPAATARKLVVSGPYCYVRNPMAVAGALQTLGVALMFGAWSVVSIAIVGALVWNVIIRPAEESDLADRFGSSYEHYCRQVRCWLPRASSFTSNY